MACILPLLFTMARLQAEKQKENNMSMLAQALNASVPTEKGGMQYGTSGSRCLDFFQMAGSARKSNMSQEDMRKHMELALAEDRETALRILLWAYDCRGGAGSRDIMRAALPYFLLKDKQDTCMHLLRAIPELGRYDMLSDLLENDDLPKDYTKLVLNIIKDALADESKAALCAKWLPRKGKAANRVRGWLKLKPAEYRHTLSKYTTTETLMSANKWGSIEYEHVPSVCFARSKAAFNKHDQARFEKFNDRAVKGEVEVHAGVVYPHDVIRDMCLAASNIGGWGRVSGPDKTVVKAAEAQWKNLPNLFGDNKQTIFPIVDVSGSMTCNISGSLQAIHVAVSLGLYCAEKQKGKFSNEVMCFSGRPVCAQLKGDLWEKVATMLNTQDNCTTDLGLCIRTIVATARRNHIPQQDMPDVLLVLSDMQFDQMSYYSHDTSVEYIKKTFEDAGYKAPGIIYWNLAARETRGVPALANEKGVITVSGFSVNILKAILDGTDLAEQCDPAHIMMKAVYQDRYDLNKY